MGNPEPAAHIEASSPFETLISVTDRLKQARGSALSLPEVLGLAETLTGALQPLLRSIDITLQAELHDILERIAALRSDIAKVRAKDISTNRIPMMGRELSAIVQATENATNAIMSSAETVLAADPTDPDYAEQVNAQMMQIFEACSFQDLTGQRVTKVVETIELIEKRINVMCDMLALADTDAADDDPETLAREQRREDQILNGPANEGEGVNQADIDKLF